MGATGATGVRRAATGATGATVVMERATLAVRWHPVVRGGCR